FGISMRFHSIWKRQSR
ncbi:hypothetical protein D046_4491B, partial [Vibrio parahaemolyticus V-223/04]